MGKTYKYDDSWHEVIKLGDGTEVLLRTIRPTDKEALRDGFERLSSQSRRMRFFGAKTALSVAELKQLTEVDGVDHFALVAAHARDGVPAEGLGVARFIRHEDQPEIAESVVTVVDGAQNKGLGTALMRHLIRAAAERGIQEFHVEFLTRNQRVLQVLLGQSRDTRFTQSGDYVHAEIPIFDAAGSANREHRNRRIFGDLLGHSAREEIELHLDRLLLKIRP